MRLLAALGVLLVVAGPARAAMCFGTGDRLTWYETPTEPRDTVGLLHQLGFPASNRLLGIWLPPDWRPAWLAGMQGAMDRGAVPVVMAWGLGDLYARGPDAALAARDGGAAWLAGIGRLAALLRGLHGTVLVALQPEFNVPGIQERPDFGRLMARAAALLHAASGPFVRVEVGTVVGDFGRYGDATADEASWRRMLPALDAALPALDFVGFQEMRGATHRDPRGVMRVFTPAQEGLPVLPQRAVAFAHFLREVTGKKLLLAYLALPDFVPPGGDASWPRAAAAATAGVLAEAPSLEREGVFGIMAISLFDDAAHNNDSADFWGNASDHFGLVMSNTRPGDSDIGAPPWTIKPEGRAWISGTEQGCAGRGCCLP